jgi:hypothetical protein
VLLPHYHYTLHLLTCTFVSSLALIYSHTPFWVTSSATKGQIFTHSLYMYCTAFNLPTLYWPSYSDCISRLQHKQFPYPATVSTGNSSIDPLLYILNHSVTKYAHYQHWKFDSGNLLYLADNSVTLDMQLHVILKGLKCNIWSAPSN